VRGVGLRSLAVFGVGLAVLAGILYIASTVDARPPAVVSIGLTHHLSGDTSVALTTTSIEIEFSEGVEPTTAEAAFRIDPAQAGTFSWAGRTLTFTPSERLPLETEFTVRILADVRDLAGNAMVEEPNPFAFETVGHPTVVSSQPENGAQDVPLESSIVLEFSTLMDTASVEAALEIEPAVELTATWSEEQLTLTPTRPFVEGQRYTLRIATGARDGAGTPLDRPYRLVFRAAHSGLEALRLVPSDGVEGIAINSPIAILFDRELDPDSLDGGLLRFSPAVTGSLEVTAPPGAEGLRDPTPRVLRFQPSSPLQPNTTYEVSLAAGVLGADGSQLATPLAWRFTTGAPLATLGNQVVFLTDRAGIGNLWSMNPDGTGQRQLSAELSPVTTYAVSPDGRTFVVGDGAVLVQQDADGDNRRLLTGAGLLEFDPAYAPDGSELAFGRADAETGGGLGLWTRPVGGGDAQRIQLPDELMASPTPTPTPEPSALGLERDPILRVPRYSPDGAAIAFVDVSGRVGVVELPGGRLTTAPFAAASPPSWLEDSTGILLSGLRPGLGIIRQPVAGAPLPELDPAALGLTETQLGRLQVAQLDRGAASVQVARSGGAGRPATGADGRYLYVVVDPESAEAGGALRLTTPGGTASSALLGDGGAPVSSASFGPEQGAIVAARVGDGIWLVDVESRTGEQLADDGWQPRWLP
jgi:hypothetical protein